MDLPLDKAADFSKWLNRAAKKELCSVIQYFCEAAGAEAESALRSAANRLREKYYGKRVFFRGLLEFSNYCKNNCYYCGLRKSNTYATRYRLTEKEIIDCCQAGYMLGFRTFVLQSGEDSYFSDVQLCRIVSAIKDQFPACAVTLSLGERSRKSYQALFDSGADRYLLRHETADEDHYRKLHPKELSLQNRQQCLYTLKDIGYQVGAGFMVDSPFQTYETLAEDLLFLRELEPHMIGLGPFIPHKDTRFAGFYKPSSHKTLTLLSLIRIMLPKVLLPATTALNSVDPSGRVRAFKAGANVVMPNLSPVSHRKDYAIYDNKAYSGEEAVECLASLKQQIKSAGFSPDFSRGDHLDKAGRSEGIMQCNSCTK